MRISRTILILTLLSALAACETPLKPLPTPSAEAPTPAPVLPVPFKLAFTPPFARGVILMLGASVKPDVVIVTDAGESFSPYGRLSFRSSSPEFVTVDSSGTITAKAMGSAWIVASLAPADHVLRDSIQVTVRCTLELSAEFAPPAAALRVGESFVPQLTLWTCGRQLQVHDTFWWRTSHASTVVRVDSATGQTTALAPGRAWLVAIGARGNGYSSLPVTVLP